MSFTASSAISLALALAGHPPDRAPVSEEVADKMIHDAYVFCARDMLSSCRTLALRAEEVAPLPEQRSTAGKLARSAEWRGGQVLDKVGRRAPGFQARSHQVAVSMGWYLLTADEGEPEPTATVVDLTYGWRVRQLSRGLGFQIEGGGSLGSYSLDDEHTDGSVARGSSPRFMGGAVLRPVFLAHLSKGKHPTRSVEFLFSAGARLFGPSRAAVDLSFPVELGFALHTGRLSWSGSVFFGPTVRGEVVGGYSGRVGIAL